MIEKIIDKNILFLQRYISCNDDEIEIYKHSNYEIIICNKKDNKDL